VTQNLRNVFINFSRLSKYNGIRLCKMFEVEMNTILVTYFVQLMANYLTVKNIELILLTILLYNTIVCECVTLFINLFQSENHLKEVFVVFYMLHIWGQL